MKPVNILFTSVGRRVELIRAFRRAYERLGVEGTIAATDLDPLAPALHESDRTFLMPPSGTSGFQSSVLSICEENEISRVFPLIDPDIPVLSEIREELRNRGAELCTVSAEGVSVCQDKWLTAQFFRSHGILSPDCWLPGDPGLHVAGLPLFIKPRGGSAGKDAFQINSRSELDFFMKYVPEPIVQEWLPGPEITTDILCALDGSVLGGVSRQRIEVRSGEVAKGVTVHHPRILELSASIAASLGARGPITVQCIMKGEEPYFTEVNPRFGGGAPLGIAAGFDSPALILSEAAGMNYPRPEFGKYRTGLYMSRFDDSLFLKDDDLKRHPRHRI